MTECIYCHDTVVDDGVYIIDLTGLELCWKSGDRHCRGFASDVWGDDPTMCIECLHNQTDHWPAGARVVCKNTLEWLKE